MSARRRLGARAVSRRGEVEYDPIRRKVRTYDVDDDRVYVQTKQDVEPVMKANAEARAQIASLRPGVNMFAGDGSTVEHVVARIPAIIYFQHPRECWEDERWVSAWLNDPANAAWRIKQGRV